MQKFEQIKRNQAAVLSIQELVFLSGLAVFAFISTSAILVFLVFPAVAPHVSVEEEVDVFSDTIYLRHCGGEPVDAKDLEIDVSINGKSYVYSSADVSENLGGKDKWELSDVIEINTNDKWGFSIANDEDVVVKLIDLDSRTLLPKIRVYDESTASSETNVREYFFSNYAGNCYDGSSWSSGVVLDLNALKDYDETNWVFPEGDCFERLDSYGGMNEIMVQGSDLNSDHQGFSITFGSDEFENFVYAARVRMIFYVEDFDPAQGKGMKVRMSVAGRTHESTLTEGGWYAYQHTFSPICVNDPSEIEFTFCDESVDSEGHKLTLDYVCTSLTEIPAPNTR